MAKISKEIALKEAMKWLASTGKESVSNTDPVDQNNLQIMAEGFEHGLLVLKETGELVQTLKFPLGDKETVKSLSYKKRTTAREVALAIASVGIQGWDGRVMGTVAASTGENSAIIGELSHVDYKYASCIGYFFM